MLAKLDMRNKVLQSDFCTILFYNSFLPTLTFLLRLAPALQNSWMMEMIIKLGKFAGVLI